MKNYAIISLISIMLFACQKHKETTSKELKAEVIDSSLNKELSEILYSKNDTILKFVSNQEGFGAFHWGVNNQFNNISKDSLHLDSIDRDIIKIKNSFVYTNSCGSACTYSLIMPITKNKKEMTAMYPLIKDENLGYLVAKGDKEGILLSVIDLTDSEVEEINGEFDKTKIPPSLVIDTIYIDNSKLSFKWYETDSKLSFREVGLNRK